MPQRPQGSPSRRCTRNRSWNDPRAPSTWRKSSIVAPLASIPGGQGLLDRARQLGPLGRRDLAGGAQRMDPGPEQRLVGIDVPDPGDPPLVEHERLDRRGAPRASSRRCAAVNAGVNGSRRAGRPGTRRAARRRASGGRSRSGEGRRRSAGGRGRARAGPACGSGRRWGQTAARRSSAGAPAGSGRPTAPRPGTCRIGPRASRSRPATAPRRRRAARAASSADRGSRHRRSSCPPGAAPAGA